MKNKELFLMEEYKSAIQLTFHLDGLRNKLTSFVISFAGIAGTGLLLILKSESNNEYFTNLNKLVAFLMILVSVMGHMFICVLARIRKVQLEHFRIVNNIRKYFLNKDYKLWNVVQLSNITLPKARLFSGTHIWLMIIQLLSSVILFIGVFLLNDTLVNIICRQGIITGTFTIVPSLIIQNLLYFGLTRLPPPIHYSGNKKPF